MSEVIKRIRHKEALVSIKKEFVDTPGTSGLVIGFPGSGKTTQLTLLAQSLFDNKETIVWRDGAKNNEIGVLGRIAPLRIFIPEGCSISITNGINDYEVIEFMSYNDIFKNFTNDVINVISVTYFMDDPIDWLKFWTFYFRELLFRARESEQKNAMSLFIDELNQVVPSIHLTMGEGHARLVSWVARNVENLRANRVRIIGAIHGWTKLAAPVRASFPVRFYKRTTSVEPDLRRIRGMIASLKQNQTMYVSPSMKYSEPIIVPNMDVGKLCNKIFVNYKGYLPEGWLPKSRFDNSKPLKSKGKLFKIIKENYVRKPTTEKNEFHEPTYRELAKDFSVHRNTVYNNIKKENDKKDIYS